MYGGLDLPDSIGINGGINKYGASATVNTGGSLHAPSRHLGIVSLQAMRPAARAAIGEAKALPDCGARAADQQSSSHTSQSICRSVRNVPVA